MKCIVLKHELQVEQAHYRQYLKELQEEEKRKEKELDRIIEEDTERQFQLKLNQWKAQKLLRKNMLEKVMAERKLQIEDKGILLDHISYLTLFLIWHFFLSHTIWRIQVQRNKERQIEIEKSKIELNRLIEFHKQQELSEWEKSRGKIQRYGEDLIDQMNYNDRQKAIVISKKK